MEIQRNEWKKKENEDSTIVRCRKFKITVKFFFGFFCTWLDRGHESDYKKVVLNFSKYIFSRKKFKMAEYRIFWGKQVNFGNDAIFLFSHYLYFSKPIFSCSLCKTDYRELYLALLKNNRVKKKCDPKWVTQA